MEWYFARDGNDVVVPNDVDRLPSPNNWGISDFPKNGENLCEELDLSISRHQLECSGNSSMSYGFQNNLQQWDAPTDQQPDFQMDDNYLKSLLDEDVATENLYGSSSRAMETDNVSTDKKLESDIQFYSNGLDDSNYFDNDAIYPTTDWNREATNSFPLIKATALKDSVASEHDNVTESMHDQTTLEESVLHRLEMVTSKLNVKTRTCFRDALYRLAENSRMNTSTPVQNEDIVPEKTSKETVKNDTFRVQEKGCTESETNAIDRAIANLMFDKMNFDMEEESQAPAAGSQNVKTEADGRTEQFQYSLGDGRTEQFQYSLGEPWSTCFPMLVGDANVPIFGK